jgi:hypothetical protein
MYGLTARCALFTSVLALLVVPLGLTCMILRACQLVFLHRFNLMQSTLLESEVDTESTSRMWLTWFRRHQRLLQWRFHALVMACVTLVGVALVVGVASAEPATLAWRQTALTSARCFWWQLSNSDGGERPHFATCLTCPVSAGMRGLLTVYPAVFVVLLLALLCYLRNVSDQHMVFREMILSIVLAFVCTPVFFISMVPALQKYMQLHDGYGAGLTITQLLLGVIFLVNMMCMLVYPLVLAAIHAWRQHRVAVFDGPRAGAKVPTRLRSKAPLPLETILEVTNLEHFHKLSRQPSVFRAAAPAPLVQPAASAATIDMPALPSSSAEIESLKSERARILRSLAQEWRKLAPHAAAVSGSKVTTANQASFYTPVEAVEQARILAAAAARNTPIPSMPLCELTLDDVLFIPDLLRIFRSFLVSALAVENIEFFVEVRGNM